jgi:hypothetical protein
LIATQKDSWWAVEVAENYADGLATDEELAHAWARARQVTVDSPAGHFWAALAAQSVVLRVYENRSWADRAIGVAEAASYAVAAAKGKVPFLRFPATDQQGYDLVPSRRGGEPYWLAIEALEERSAQADLFRDVVAFPVVAGDQASGHGPQSSSVLGMARSIYEHRRFDLLASLADDLKVVSDTDRHVLEHCRTGKTHIRGCWVLESSGRMTYRGYRTLEQTPLEGNLSIAPIVAELCKEVSLAICESLADKLADKLPQFMTNRADFPRNVAVLYALLTNWSSP